MGKDKNGREIGRGYSWHKGSEMYMYRFTNRFGTRQVLYDESLTALRKAAKYAEAEDGERRAPDKKITLEKYFKTWLFERKHGIIGDTTTERYRDCYERYVKSLGKMKLDAITTLDLDKLINQMDRDGRGYETKNMVFKMLNSLFKCAIEDRYLGENPISSLRRKMKKYEEGEDSNPRFLQVKDQTDFMNAAYGTFFYNLYSFLLESGCRIGEATALVETDFNFDTNTVTISKSLSYQKLLLLEDEHKTFRIGTTKNKASRVIPLPGVVMGTIRKQIKLKAIVSRQSCAKHFDDKRFENLLFVSRFNNPLCDQTVIDAIKRVVTEVNYMRDEAEQLENFTPHAFRHTYASNCLHYGISIKMLQTFLGHKTYQMTCDLYSHILDDYHDEELEKIEKSSMARKINLTDAIKSRQETDLSDVKILENPI